MVNTKQERTWMEAIVVSYEFSLYLLGRSEVKHKKH